MSKCSWFPTSCTRMSSGSKVWLDNQFPRAPSSEEVALHELSHVYRDWCPYCVNCKGKQDPERPVEFSADDRRSVPSIEVDYSYSKVDWSDAVSTVLVAIDSESKMLSSMPVPSESFNLRGQAGHLVRFSMALNLMDTVEFVSDAEPIMRSLLASVQLLRQHVGYLTVVTQSRLGDKSLKELSRPWESRGIRWSTWRVRDALCSCWWSSHLALVLSTRNMVAEQVPQPHHNEDITFWTGFWAAILWQNRLIWWSGLGASQEGPKHKN